MNPTLRSLLQLNELDQQQIKTFDKEQQEKLLPKTVLRAGEIQTAQVPEKKTKKK